MRLRLLLPIAAAATVAFAAPAYADDDDDVFIRDLNSSGIHYPDKDQATMAGKMVCSLSDSGMSDDDIVSNLTQQNEGLSQDKATKFESMAKNAYCPGG